MESYTRKLPLEQLNGCNPSAVNKWISLDVNIPVGEDETLAFAGKNDAVLFDYFQSADPANNLFTNKVATTPTKPSTNEVLAIAVYTTETRAYAEHLAALDSAETQLAEDTALRAALKGKSSPFSATASAPMWITATTQAITPPSAATACFTARTVQTGLI